MEKPQPAIGIELLEVAPHGLDEIIATFGDIRQYVGAGGELDPRWETDFLAVISLPFPLRLSWDLSRTINRMTCHRRMTAVYASVFATVQERGLRARVASFGGCFAYRPSAPAANCQPTVGE